MMTMKQMSLKLRKTLPNVDVLGELRDAPGVLVRVPVDDVNASTIDILEQKLVRAGASGWHWAPDSRGNTLKVRVYFERRWALLVVGVLAIVVLGSVWQYDVLHHFAEAVRL